MSWVENPAHGRFSLAPPKFWTILLDRVSNKLQKLMRSEFGSEHWNEKFEIILKLKSKIQDVFGIALKWSLNLIVIHSSTKKFLPENSGIHLPNSWSKIFLKYYISHLLPRADHLQQIIQSQRYLEILQQPLLWLVSATVQWGFALTNLSRQLLPLIHLGENTI